MSSSSNSKRRMHRDRSIRDGKEGDGRGEGDREGLATEISRRSRSPTTDTGSSSCRCKSKRTKRHKERLVHIDNKTLSPYIIDESTS